MQDISEDHFLKSVQNCMCNISQMTNQSSVYNMNWSRSFQVLFFNLGVKIRLVNSGQINSGGKAIIRRSTGEMGLYCRADIHRAIYPEF